MASGALVEGGSARSCWGSARKARETRNSSNLRSFSLASRSILLMIF